MATVSFEEFENAKLEIIRGVEYHEDTSTTDYGTTSKTYSTEKNGTFYEVTDPNKPGVIEFWSTKHPESRFYDDRSRDEIKAYYEEIIANYKKENAQLAVLKNEYQRAMNDNHEMVTALMKTVEDLKVKLVAIKALTHEVAE